MRSIRHVFQYLLRAVPSVYYLLDHAKHSKFVHGATTNILAAAPTRSGILITSYDDSRTTHCLKAKFPNDYYCRAQGIH